MPEDITLLLRRWSDGDSEALSELTPLVYDEIRKLARGHLNHERENHTLQPTVLAHEAYLRLVNRQTGNWNSRAQFYAVASQVIRRVLVDHARTRLREKRGGGQSVISLDPSMDFPLERNLQLAALDDALTELAKLDELESRIVELRFFTGLTFEEIAPLVDVSEATVKRRWATARAWLRRELDRSP